MRAAVAMSGLFGLSLLAGCSSECQPGPSVPIKAFALHDITGLDGGSAIWASANHTAVVQLVSPGGKAGLQERRYNIKLTGEQWAEMETLLVAHCFATIKMSERPGIPDEAHPIVVVVTQDGKTLKARKWARDKHQDFDLIYAYLLTLCRAEGEPIYEGAFNVNWHPDGFELLWK
jgi:hypothetical protein